MCSPAMMLRLLPPRPLFAQASVRVRTCTSTIYITHLQSERSRFKRDVQIYMQRSDPRAIVNTRRRSLLVLARRCRCRHRSWSRRRCCHWCWCRGCCSMQPLITSTEVLYPPCAGGVPTPAHDPVQWITKRRHPIIITDSGSMTTNVLRC
jgi:hypothetical protein